MVSQEEPRFLPYLLKDEKVLWAGAPVHDPLMGPKDLLFFFINLLWVGALFILVPFVLIWHQLLSLKGPLLLLFFLLFSGLAVYIIFGKLFSLYRKKRLTWFAVTNTRLMVLTRGIFQIDLKTLYAETLKLSHKSVGANGVGTLRFGTTDSAFMMHAGSSVEKVQALFGDYILIFYDISDAAKVFDLVENIRKTRLVSQESVPE